MTVEQRLEQVEQQNQKIQRANKRLTVGLTMMAVVMCAVVTMAATDFGKAQKSFDVVMAKTLVARTIMLINDADNKVVSLGSDDAGDGLVWTQSAEGNDLVKLSATVDGNGVVDTYQPNGKSLLSLSSAESVGGGQIAVFNKTGELIAGIQADGDGNGEVWAFNRNGNGRSLKVGP